MNHKFFAISARHPQQVEDELNAFCRQHRISYIEKQLINDGADSFWSICITWLDGEIAASHATEKSKSPAIDYKQVLNEADFSLYLELRNFRKELAGLQNVPPYALFTNAQLAEMIQKRIASKAELMQITGVGKSRIDKYGDRFLGKLKDYWNQHSMLTSDETNPLNLQ